MKCVPDLRFDAEHDLSFDLYLPDQMKAKACVVYAHGGGFRKGSRHDGAAEQFAVHLTEVGFAMASVSYRLGTPMTAFSPERQSYISSYMHRTASVGLSLSSKLYGPAFIAALEDLSRAIEYLWVEGSNLGITTRKTGLLGISAGGIAGLSLAFPPTHWQVRLVKPDAVVAISSAIVQPWRLSEKGPPCLMLHGPNDRITPMRDAEFGAARAEQVGAPVRLIETGVPGHATQVDAVLDGATDRGGTRFIDLIIYQYEAMLDGPS
ncbi:MAG: hypothetical protein AAF700_11200 [Pseudomonadota bacterium]